MEKGYTIYVLDNGFVRYVDSMGSDTSICEAARVSYRAPSKGPEQDERLIEYLWRNKHYSPFEMVKIKFNIKLPIFVMRQFVRHRMQNLNEVSARYTIMPDEFYIPSEWRVPDVRNKQSSIVTADLNHKELSEKLDNYCRASYQFYVELLASGVAREMARMVLPVNLYTEIYSCWDLRNLLNFIRLREDAHAQFEIREYAKAMKEICSQICPITIKCFDKYP